MNCDAALPLLYSLVDGDAGRDDAVAVALHLASCPGCAEKLRQIQAADRFFAERTPVSAPPELARRITAAAAAAADRPLPRRSGNRSAGIAAVVAAACATAVLAIVGLPASFLHALERAGGAAAAAAGALTDLHPPDAAALADAWTRFGARLAAPAVLGGSIVLAAALVALQIGGSALLLLGRRKEGER